MPSSPLPSEMPPYGQFFEVFVTFAANPFNFAVQSRKSRVKFSELMLSMNEFYNNKESAKTCRLNGPIQEGCYYAVKHTDNYWYR